MLSTGNVSSWKFQGLYPPESHNQQTETNRHGTIGNNGISSEEKLKLELSYSTISDKGLLLMHSCSITCLYFMYIMVFI